MNSLKACDSSLKALMVYFLPSGHTIVTITIFVSASEAITDGCIFSILQLESSNFFSSEME